MTDGAYIAMWLGALELLFRHFNPPLITAHKQIRTADPVLTKNVLFLLSYVGTCSYYIEFYKSVSSGSSTILEGAGFEPA